MMVTTVAPRPTQTHQTQELDWQDCWQEDLLEKDILGRRIGWQRLIRDLMESERLERDREVVTKAALQVDLTGETSRRLTKQILSAVSPN